MSENFLPVFSSKCFIVSGLTFRIPHFLYPSFTGEHFNCFHVLSIVNNADWTWECKISFWIIIFCFLDICPGVELLAHMVTLFLAFWETWRVFHSGRTNLHYYQEYMRVLFSLYPPQHFLLTLRVVISWESLKLDVVYVRVMCCCSLFTFVYVWNIL